jgi:hypothetical protein
MDMIATAHQVFCAFVCALLAIGMNSVTRIHDVAHAMPNAAS